MSWAPSASLLRGLTVEQASCLGMPHNGAYYTGSGDAHRIVDGMHCVRCRVNPATNAHHEPQKGMGGHRSLVLHGKLLRPSLHALCGSGNASGCHGLRHQGKIGIRWVWDSDDYMRAWWEGEFFADGFEPHDPRLYDYGRWDYEPRKKV